LKINKTFIKRSSIKIKNQNKKNENWNTKNKEVKHVLFRLGKRKEWGKRSPVTNHPLIIITCHTMRKRTQRRFQWHGGRACVATGRHHTRCSKRVDASHAQTHYEQAWTTFLNKKLRIQNKKNKILPMSLKFIKNRCERIKIPLNVCLILLVLKGKNIFLLYSKKWKDRKINDKKFYFFNFKG